MTTTTQPVDNGVNVEAVLGADPDVRNGYEVATDAGAWRAAAVVVAATPG